MPTGAGGRQREATLGKVGSGVLAALVAYVLAGCGGVVASLSPAPIDGQDLTPAPTSVSAATHTAGATAAPSIEPGDVTGTFVGTFKDVLCPAISPDVESDWPSPPADVYELFLPEGYTYVRDPLRILGPKGDLVATRGDLIEVVGTIPRVFASTCMIGPQLSTTEVRAAD